MLQIRDICKKYCTGSLIQKALDHVSLNLRDNEFVAILGPSGSGKTTLLNIIGGLDRYDSGDLVINGISTRKYTDRDWDSYRNHTIGFVFQSYNLISHQTILSNVELALTISGIGKMQRRKRAKEALARVGLGDQLHKRPGQLSGGQMQRVAIARALVNDPDILLADEPTGALDSETSVQVMELLKEVASDRLVVMVTHNPELAREYATRIVNLKDGKILSDTDPFVSVGEGEAVHRNMGKASMSFLTALSLSFNNLRTKKARTLLTSFAGSIGIIGIALILSLSTGVNNYIKDIEKETLSEYPLQIQSTGFDFSSILMGGESSVADEGTEKEGDVHVISMVTDMFSTLDSNDLKSLKSYLDSEESGIAPYVNAVEYSYNVVPQIFRETEEEVYQVHPDTSFQEMGFGSGTASNSMMSAMMSTDVFFEMPREKQLYEKQYDIRAGRWPRDYNECVLVLTSGGGMSDQLLYTLGLRDRLELQEMVRQFVNEENIDTPDTAADYSYNDILGTKFRLVDHADYYEYDSQYQVWKDKSSDSRYMQELVANGEELSIVGIVQPSKDAKGFALSHGIGYPAALTAHLQEKAATKEIVRQQMEDPSINVFTGEAFGQGSDEDRFDINSLFTVDEAKLAQAFGLDGKRTSLLPGTSGVSDMAGILPLTENSLDLSGALDLSEITIGLETLPHLNLAEILADMDVKVSPDGMTQLTGSLLEGYRQYASQHPEADYSGLSDAFAAYLNTEEGRDILIENLRDIIDSGIGISLTVEELRAMASDLMEGYARYTSLNPADPSFDAYLGTEEARQILNQYAGNIFGDITDNIAVSEEQISKLASELAQGYLDYAAQGNGPDPTRMPEYFLDYLGTPDGQQRLSDGLTSVVDMEDLERQISQAVAGYMQDVSASYGQMLEQEISSAMEQIANQLAGGLEKAVGSIMSQMAEQFQKAMSIDGEAFAEAFQINMTGEELAEIMMSVGSSENATYENNLKNLGYADFEVPSSIDIYPKDFESKQQIINILDDYNARMEAEGKEEQVITYTDVVGTLMSSVTDIVDIISYVLIAFVAISLIVSSIMIGVITYISVLERKKEIGILRAIGASKGNISEVFNAETFIIGLCAGLIGIGISLLLLIPGNALIHYLAGTNNVSASLPVVPGVVLVLLSIMLTLLGGLIPSRKAAKSDPVSALRTE